MGDATSSTDVYSRLREYLDGLPAGYPETPTGVEIKLLEKIFTPEEAEMFTHCKLVAEPPSAIAKRAGMPEDEASEMLARMSRKGHLFPVESGGDTLYMALPWMPGIIETQLRLMDEEFAHMILEHNKTYFPSWTDRDVQMFRVIPVESSIEATPTVETYDRIRELVKQQKQISVMPCLCRSTQATLGSDCGRPRESCFVFGPYTKHFVENGDARYISVGEALDLLDECEKAALVLQPVNARELNGMCTCCSCCCNMLKGLRTFERPADHAGSSFQAKIDPDLCTACGTCLDRCQIEAIIEGDEYNEVDLARCIGCGLCVSTCPEEAVEMVLKAEVTVPPDNIVARDIKLATERGVI